MKGNKHMKTTTSITYPAFALFTLAWFAFSPQAQAVCREGCDTDNGNTFLGDNALLNNTTGDANTATGSSALISNTTGFSNTATGAVALGLNTTGFDNTANGVSALRSNTTGFSNTATGFQALYSSTTGSSNTANGASALASNTTGADNTANGLAALLSNTTGSSNTANGFFALLSNTTGFNNTATGVNALLNNTTGIKNTASGFNALSSNTTGGNNIALGQSAGANLTTGNGNIDIGNAGVAGEAKTIRIGTTGTQTNAYIAGISGATVPTGVAVIVDASGHLGTTTSSARFKEAIKPMDKASEAILSLQPVTFRYKHDLDPEGIPQFGLVAEDVAKVNPDLVVRNGEGKVYTVRYEAVNAMLLNEFLKAHRRIEEQDKRIDQLTAQLKEQAVLIQKVNDKVELNRPAPRTVAERFTRTAHGD
jgi:trimeric autotransporter adhesin